MSDDTRTGSFAPGSEGTAHTQCKTTAAEAQEEVSTCPAVAREVKENVIQSREAAQKAAQAAQGMGPEFTGEPVSGFDVLHNEAEARFSAAIAQGQKDVENVKDVGAQYAQQAQTMAKDAVASAQNTLRGAFKEHPRSQGSSTGVSAPESTLLRDTTIDALTSLQTTASSALGATKQYLTSARDVVQPQVDRAREAAGGFVEKGAEVSELRRMK